MPARASRMSDARVQGHGPALAEPRQDGLAGGTPRSRSRASSASTSSADARTWSARSLPAASLKRRMSYQAGMISPPLMVTPRRGACGKTKRTRGRREHRHDVLEVVAARAQAVQPDDRAVGLSLAAPPRRRAAGSAMVARSLLREARPYARRRPPDRAAGGQPSTAMASSTYASRRMPTRTLLTPGRAGGRPERELRERRPRAGPAGPAPAPPSPRSRSARCARRPGRAAASSSVRSSGR